MEGHAIIADIAENQSAVKMWLEALPQSHVLFKGWMLLCIPAKIWIGVVVSPYIMIIL